MSIWHHVRQNTARLLFSLAQYVWFLCLYIESEPLVQLGPIHLRECLWNALSRPIAERRNQASTAARLCYRTLLLTYHFHRDVQVLLFGECDNSVSFHLQDVWFIARCTGCIPCINVSILTLHCRVSKLPSSFLDTKPLITQAAYILIYSPVLFCSESGGKKHVGCKTAGAWI